MIFYTRVDYATRLYSALDAGASLAQICQQEVPVGFLGVYEDEDLRSARAGVWLPELDVVLERARAQDVARRALRQVHREAKRIKSERAQAA